MIDIKDVQIGGWLDEVKFTDYYSLVIDKQIKKTVNDIAKEVEKAAKKFAPIGSGFAGGGNFNEVPGTLKKRGVLREPVHATKLPGDFGVRGSFVTNIPAIGGGFSIRGGNLQNRGQFSKRTTGLDQFLEPGHVFRGGGGNKVHYSAAVFLNPELDYARWVHEGTGIYGPFHAPITPTVSPFLRFRWHGRRFKKKSVRGQNPQPFLTKAYAYVNNLYANAKVSQLRAELAAEL